MKDKQEPHNTQIKQQQQVIQEERPCEGIGANAANGDSGAGGAGGGSGASGGITCLTLLV